MSYDLFFARRDGGSLDAAAFAAHFAGRRGYGLRGDEAHYVDEDTGVYCTFRRESPRAVAVDPDETADEDPFEPVASFELNYFRPPFFGLEAADEVAAFVAAFDLVVDDPQVGGMGRGELDREGFLAGWNLGNRMAHALIPREHGAGARFAAYPEAGLLAAWRWNRDRRRRQEAVGNGVFVPRISWVDVDGEPRTGAVWPDALPTVLPEVDLVIVGRQELAPRRFLLRRPDIVPVPWRQLAPLLAAYPAGAEPLPHRELLADPPPAELVAFVRDLPSHRGRVQALPAHQVLSAELLAAGRDQPPAEVFSVAPDGTVA